MQRLLIKWILIIHNINQYIAYSHYTSPPSYAPNPELPHRSALHRDIESSDHDIDSHSYILGITVPPAAWCARYGWAVSYRCRFLGGGRTGRVRYHRAHRESALPVACRYQSARPSGRSEDCGVFQDTAEYIGAILRVLYAGRCCGYSERWECWNRLCSDGDFRNRSDTLRRRLSPRMAVPSPWYGDDICFQYSPVRGCGEIIFVVYIASIKNQRVWGTFTWLSHIYEY